MRQDALANRKRAHASRRSETTVPTRASSAAILETFANPSRRPYWIRFNRRISPRSAQSPARLISRRSQIDYQPANRCLETKSLKFYLASYRNERAFNEAVTNHILDDLVRACAPRQMIVTAEFASRGGISLTITATYPDEIEPRPTMKRAVVFLSGGLDSATVLAIARADGLRNPRAFLSLWTAARTRACGRARRSRSR